MKQVLNHTGILVIIVLLCSILFFSCSETNNVYNEGSDEQPPGDLVILDSDHPGWSRGDCFHCHPLDNLSASHSGIEEEYICQGCHGENGTGSGIELCTTCHGYSPDSGAHTRHYPGLVSSCLACHSTSGGSSPNHRNHVVDVVLDSAYGGTWNGMSCSSVSCHGCGTPLWYTDRNLECTACHSITCGAFNDIGSGKHPEHLARVANDCSICHSSGPSTHYNGVMDNPDNIHPDGGEYTDYTPDGYARSGVSGSCSGMVSPCHGGTSDWVTGNACGTCHGASNTNPPDSCAHPLHAGATMYNYACSVCHSGLEYGNTSRHINGNADVIFDTASLAGNNGPIYNGTSCLNIYCHGEGAPALTGGTNTCPRWCDSSSTYCGSCHGASAAQPPLSGSHEALAGSSGQAYPCTTCHNAFPSRHVNGMRDVRFFAGPAGENSDGYYSSGTCNRLYCHGEGNPSLDGGSDTTPEWGNPSTVYCGSCHGIPPMVGQHDFHVVSMGFSCSECHFGAGSGTANHVNYVRDIIFDPGGSVPTAYFSGGKCFNMTGCHFAAPVDGRDWY